MGEEISPAFQFYAKDWLVDTAHMTYEEKGVYIDLLCRSWVDVGLPDDQSRLQKLLSLSAHKMKKVWPTVAEKFVQIEDRLFNRRLERERRKQALRRAQMSEAGKKGAEARYGQSYSDAIAKPSQGHSSASSTAVEKEKPLDNSFSNEPSTAEDVKW